MLPLQLPVVYWGVYLRVSTLSDAEETATPDWVLVICRMLAIMLSMLSLSDCESVAVSMLPRPFRVACHMSSMAVGSSMSGLGQDNVPALSLLKLVALGSRVPQIPKPMA